jgi:hypothetical protein
LIIKSFGNGLYTISGATKVLKSVAINDVTWPYWEYKIALDGVTYSICSDGKDLAPIPETSRVCEVDFAVTNHYLVQKSPYWTIASSTPLVGYKHKDGTALFLWNDEVKWADYSVPSSLNSTYTTFIKKYSGSAVKLDNVNCNWHEVRKVKWKSIYFVQGKGDVDLSCIKASTNIPFTFIAKDWANIIIKWSLYSNAMIMTEWEIIFDAWWFSNWDTKTACNWDRTKYGHAWQMVKWIFYAKGGFKSINDKYNDNVDNDEWCNYWNLHIKWVAIWDLTNVVNARRSELYTWFNKDKPGNKETVLNWASVLVEYSPDLWGSLPPGAEEFNKALEVYRK